MLFRRFHRPKPQSRQRDLGFAPSVTVKMHSDGAVFLHSARGVVYSCNAIGAKVWTGLRDGSPLAEIAAVLAKEYGVSADVVGRDAGAFVDELEAAGILVRGGHAIGV
jgi:hypothetical protein